MRHLKSLQACVLRRVMHCEYYCWLCVLRSFFSLACITVCSLQYLYCTSLNSTRTDVLTDFTILVSELELPPGVMAVLLDGMSQVEHRLAFGTDEKLQAASLVGVFVQARHMMKVA